MSGGRDRNSPVFLALGNGRPGWSGRDSYRAYRVAGCDLLVDGVVPELGAFAVDPPLRVSIPTPVPTRPVPDAEPIFDGSSWIGGAERPVSLARHGDLLELAVGTSLRIHLEASGRSLRVVEAASVGAALFAETVLGPGLILALARRDVYCLHAGAVELDGRALVFLGESGAGKSTLVRALRERGARLLSDDILPVRLDDKGRLSIPGAFPQLKLSITDQPVIPFPAPVDTLYRLRPAEPDRTVERHPMSRTDAALALVRHTASSRLFETEPLRRQFRFAGDAAERLRVYDLVYPHADGAVDAVVEVCGNSKGQDSAALPGFYVVK